jgi:hypothetical protein
VVGGAVITGQTVVRVAFGCADGQPELAQPTGLPPHREPNRRLKATRIATPSTWL